MYTFKSVQDYIRLGPSDKMHVCQSAQIYENTLSHLAFFNHLLTELCLLTFTWVQIGLRLKLGRTLF